MNKAESADIVAKFLGTFKPILLRYEGIAADYILVAMQAETDGEMLEQLLDMPDDVYVETLLLHRAITRAKKELAIEAIQARNQFILWLLRAVLAAALA